MKVVISLAVFIICLAGGFIVYMNNSAEKTKQRSQALITEMKKTSEVKKTTFPTVMQTLAITKGEFGDRFANAMSHTLNSRAYITEPVKEDKYVNVVKLFLKDNIEMTTLINKENNELQNIYFLLNNNGNVKSDTADFILYATATARALHPEMENKRIAEFIMKLMNDTVNEYMNTGKPVRDYAFLGENVYQMSMSKIGARFEVDRKANKNY